MMRTPFTQREMGRNAQFLTLGLQLALSAAVFTLIGWWLDGKYGTSPWLLLAGAFVGVTGGMIKFIRTALQIGREADQEQAGRKTE